VVLIERQRPFYPSLLCYDARLWKCSIRKGGTGMNELDMLLNAWDYEAKNTITMLKALPAGQYDFRPDAGGRSLGELAWHLAEGDAYMSCGIEQGFTMGMKPPNIERPRSIEELAPAYERVHREAVARVRKLKPEDFDRSVPFFGGQPMTIRNILWGAMYAHNIHHRGQLSLMCRLAGGCPPGLYGPNREEMAAMRAATTKAS
jgi:uncharacterized damage-inducible protein DinB